MAEDEDRKNMDAYLGKNVRKTEATSSLLKSTSEWLNNGKIRELIAMWMLRKNGPDFPVEADHTLGLAQAFGEVLPDSEILALFEEEMANDPKLDAWVKEGFVSTFTNEDFLSYPAGTVGGLIGHQVREYGYDMSLGMGWKKGALNPLQYFRLRTGQSHDLEHILTGGQFNSLGEIAITFGRCANQSQHLSPKLASALNAYMMFAGLRMITRSLLHYPETWVAAIKNLEQGIRVGLASPPFWYMKWEEVFEMTPAEAQTHFGVPVTPFVESHKESVIFRQDAPRVALAAE